jgi:hypothetical protein
MEAGRFSLMSDKVITAADIKEIYGITDEELAKGMARTQRRLAFWFKKYPGKMLPVDSHAAEELTEEEIDEWYSIE